MKEEKGLQSSSSTVLTSTQAPLELKGHTTTKTSYQFVCVFSFAGCQSRFTSKNEWKHHVSSQHLNVYHWVCELEGCGAIQGSSQGETLLSDIIHSVERIHSLNILDACTHQPLSSEVRKTQSGRRGSKIF
jgi:hypothetical protein